MVPNRPRVSAFLLAENAVKEAESGKISLFNIWSGVHSAKVPVMFGPMAIYLKVDGIRPNTEYAFKIAVRNPDNQPILAADGNFTTNTPSAELLVPIKLLPLNAFGEYKIDFHVGDDRIAVTTFRVDDSAAKTKG